MQTQLNKWLISFSLLISTSSFAAEIDYAHTFDLNDYKGQTYLSFMEGYVKPAMDELATNGYEVCDANAIETAYEASDKKVQNKVKRNFGGLENVKSIVAELSGETVTLNDLPAKIAAVDRSVDRFDLSTFIGLACGGGVKIVYDHANHGLNVHYDTTEQRSGRSFGVGPTRAANDASDKQYLEDLQEYARSSKDDLPDFYSTLFESLLNSDPSGYADVQEEGQTVLTDFLSVFTAEQARNLMDGSVTPHWDAALLEVTLLASFHAGQSKVKLYYQNPQSKKTSFTDSTLKQTPCASPAGTQQAHMRDYWQFSRNITDPKNCRRSGINITKAEFRKLGEAITTYIYDNHRDIYDRVNADMGNSKESDNLFKSLSYFLISGRSPEKFSTAKVRQITQGWVQLLGVLTKEANAISKELEAAE